MTIKQTGENFCMTRIKKFLVSGLLVLVSCCTFLGSAITNFAQSIFSFGSASASSFNGGNTNTGGSLSQGNILTVKNVPTSVKRDGTEIELPFINSGVSVSNTTGGAVSDYVLYALGLKNQNEEIIEHYNTCNDGSNACRMQR